jgi:hypothetical protein
VFGGGSLCGMMIAADPNNSKNLIGMISDFSQRGGFNTSKFSVSKDGGKTWKESFVPESGGSPATGDGAVWQANSDQPACRRANLSYIAVSPFWSEPQWHCDELLSRFYVNYRSQEPHTQPHT